MKHQFTEQLGIAVLVIVAGISGWLLPGRWNLLRLKRGFANLFPDRVNEAIPKVLGTILIALGLALVIGAFAIR